MTIEAPLFALSHDRKTRSYKGQKNTLGFLPGPDATCPYATTGEGGCWSVETHKIIPTCYVAKAICRLACVKNSLKCNTEKLKQATLPQLVAGFNIMLSQFRERELKRDKPMLYFRWHWSGDIYTRNHAKAMRETMLHNPDISFWLYTRSFPYVNLLSNIPNLSLYLSLDRQNLIPGLKTYCANNSPTTKLAYMSPTDDWQNQLLKAKDRLSSGEFRKLRNISLTACPVDKGKVPFEDSCMTCKLCVANNKNHKFHIWFKTK